MGGQDDFQRVHYADKHPTNRQSCRSANKHCSVGGTKRRACASYRPRQENPQDVGIWQTASNSLNAQKQKAVEYMECRLCIKNRPRQSNSMLEFKKSRAGA